MLVVIVMCVWFVFNFGRSHFYGHIADTFNLIRLSRFAEQNKGGSYLPTAALLRSLQWVSDRCVPSGHGAE